MAFSFKELFKKEDHEDLHGMRKLSFHPVEEDPIQNDKNNEDAIKVESENMSPFELVEESSQVKNRGEAGSKINSNSDNAVLHHDNKDNGADLNCSDEPSLDRPFSWTHNPVHKEYNEEKNPFLEQEIEDRQDQEIQNIPGANNSSDFFLSESEIDKNFSFIKEESLEELRGNEFWPLGEAESSKLKKTAVRSLEALSPTSRNAEENASMPFILDDGKLDHEYILKQIEVMPGIKGCVLIHENEEPLMLSQLACSSEYFNKSFIAELKSFCSNFISMNENPLTISYKQDRVSCFDCDSFFIGILHGPDELGSQVEQKIINLLTQISKTTEIYQ
ncbi:MAG: hypothetical protein ACJ0K4_01295 [Verrucomicrobiales bacterium]